MNYAEQHKGSVAYLSSSEVLKRDIPWETYMTAKLINSRGLQLLRRYDHKPGHVKARCWTTYCLSSYLDVSSSSLSDGVAYVQVSVGILRYIFKQDTVEYVLALIDGMLSDKSLESEDVYDTVLRLLSKKWCFIQENSCKILTLSISARPIEEPQPTVANGKQPISELDKTLSGLVDWLRGQLRHPFQPLSALWLRYCESVKLGPCL